MTARAGDRIIIESEKVGQPARSGVIEEVLRQYPPRYRVRWDNGETTVIAPEAGAARIEAQERRGG